MEILVLIVDDSPDDRESYVRMLKKVEGTVYRYIEAGEGAKALELIAGRHPDCVLLDYSLPGANGINVLKQIRELEAFLPVIMFTGQGNEAVAVQAIKEGAQDYLVKSDVTPDLLNRTIASAIDHVDMERSLKEHQGHIRRQAEELKFINEELETFTYIASHDMRSPLVSLKGFSCELTRSVGAVVSRFERLLPSLPEEDRAIVQKEICECMPKALHYIAGAADRLDRLSASILKLARVGRREIIFEPVDTREMVTQCLAALAHQIEKTHTTVNIGDMPTVIADRAFLEQIFGNLLDNALKYLDPARPGRLQVKGIHDDSQTEFIVTDNGRGIAEEDQHKVFEIFRRGGDVENIPGEGMGMPYVRAIVRRHHGNIWLESKPGEGTTFHFTIANNTT
jgi:signal transduction histidine kinase